MPQTTIQFLRGYVHLTFDTLTQRLRCPKTPSHGVFTADGNYLYGQTAIVTGANTGIGLSTTRYLARAGANVILACRNVSKAQDAVKNILIDIPNASLEIIQLDLLDLNSVRTFTKTFGERVCDMLILNGGVMGASQTNPETHFMTNHVGHALLCLLFLGSLAKDARIVFVSSLTFVISDLRLDDISFETRPYRWMTAYANSKLAMVMFMRALCRRVDGSGIKLNAVHPGEAPSDVSRYLGNIWATLHKTVGPLFLLTVDEAARTSVYLAGNKHLDGNGKTYHRISEEIQMSDWLRGVEEEEKIWDLTLKLANVTDQDLIALRKLQEETTIDETN